MLYPMKPAKLDYTNFFNKKGVSIQQFEDEILPSMKSCTGAKISREETGIFQSHMFGHHTRLNIVSWKTSNFKGEPRTCAAAVFELLEDESFFLWNIFFTTCDFMFLDNFSHPLGPDHKLERGDPADKSASTGFVKISPALPSVEQLLFLQKKLYFHLRFTGTKILTDPDYLEKLRQRATTSRFLGSTGLREMLAVYATGTPTAAQKKEAIGASCSAEEFEKFEKEEKEALRAVVLSLTPKQFYDDCYLPWLASAMTLPKDLYPAEYKKRGRWLLLSEEEAKRWDRMVFLGLVGIRAQLVKESPYDSALWLNSQSLAFAEVSDEDMRYAVKTPGKGKKLGDMLADHDGIAWLINKTEEIVIQQRDFLAKLKKAVDAKDFDAALTHLTQGTAEPMNGQALLGLSEALLRDLTNGSIVFPQELIDSITEFLDGEWSLPLLDIQTTDDPKEKTWERLFMVGEPSKELAERSGSAASM